MVDKVPDDMGCVFHSQSHFVGFCQSPSCQQCAIHTVSKERGGDNHAMASCQSVLSEG